MTIVVIQQILISNWFIMVTHSLQSRYTVLLPCLPIALLLVSGY